MADSMGRNSPSLSSKKRKVAPTINKIAPTVDKAVATIDNSAADQDNPVPKSILSKTSSAEIGLSPGQRLSLDVVSSPPRRGSSPSPGLPSSGPNSGNSPGPSRKKFGSNRSFSTNSLNSSHSNSQHNSHSYSHGHSLSHSHSNSLNSNVDNATVNSGKSSKKRRNSQSTLFTSVESIRSRDNENDDDLESNYTATVSNKNSKYVAPLEIPLQKKIIVEEIGNHVDELRMAEMLERKIVLSTLVCLISNVIGVIMVLYALQLTDAFASARDNYPLFYASLVFFTPTLVFIRIVFLPGRAEVKKRKQIREWRRHHALLELKRKATFHGWDLEPYEDAERIEDRLMSIDSNLFDHDEDEQSKVDENNNNSFSLGGGLNYKKLVLNNDITPSKSSMKLQKTPKRSIKVPDINTKNMTQKVSVRFADDKSSPIRFPKK